MPAHPAALAPDLTPKAQPRVVSLLPSATELLCAAGGRHLLVGRSHECDFPTGIESLPILTAQRTRSTDPAAIDREVSASLAVGDSLYTLNEALLTALKPDLILTQDLCSVCSIDLRAVERVVAGLVPRPAVLSLNPSTVEDVLDDLLRVGEAAGLGANATRAMVDLRARLFQASEFINPFADGPSVGFLEWTDPLFCAGHWSVELIERAGGRHPLNPTLAAPDAGAAAGPQRAQRRAGPSRRISPDEFVASRPEFLIIAPCGMNLAAAKECTAQLARQPWWDDLAAVRSGRVAVVDGNQMFNRPGPRLLDAFEWLTGFLNGRPELVPRGFPWERFG